MRLAPFRGGGDRIGKVEQLTQQRLLRRICKVCGGSGKVNSVRCERCVGTGYSGRAAVYEIMTMTDEIRAQVAKSADAVTIRELAVKQGFKPMRIDAFEKMRAGLTTEEEIRRVLE